MPATKLVGLSSQWGFQSSISEELQEISKIEILKQVYAIVFDWFLILGSIAVCKAYFNLPLYLITILVVAGRQHALLAIMHEAAHFRLTNNRALNDLLGNYFGSFPILAATEWYREHHLKHHKFLNTKQDPDWSRKVDLEEWKFPQPQSRFIKTILKQFIFGGYEWLKLMTNMSGLFPLTQLRNQKRILTLFHKIIYYTIALFFIFKLGLGHLFLMYWLVPLLVIFPALQRIRSISEHFGLKHTHKLNHTRNIEAGWFERSLFGPHNINYHLIHHLYPSVPQHNLKKLHQRLLTFTDYRDHSHQNDSYLRPSHKSLLRDLIKNRSDKNISLIKLGG